MPDTLSHRSTQYCSIGMATVGVRVCGSAGRDKTKLEQKLTSTTTTMNAAASFPSKGTDESDSEGEEGHADLVSYGEII